MAKKPQTITAICESHNQLNYLTERSQKLIQLNSVLQKVLPKQLYGRCRLANITKDSLVIQTDTAQCASLLRFDAPRICKAMNEHINHQVTRLNVKVNANIRYAQTAPKIERKLPISAAQSIKQMADVIEEGPLKSALNRLAQRKK
jgi:hypothetical protein